MSNEVDFSCLKIVYNIGIIIRKILVLRKNLKKHDKGPLSVKLFFRFHAKVRPWDGQNQGQIYVDCIL
jgi:hypothetical protein